MSRNEETISIDLTEDDTDLQEKQPQVQYLKYNANIIRHGNIDTAASQDNSQLYSAYSPNKLLSEKQDSVLSKNEVQSSVLDSPEELAINFIENLQKENPQIETVFIESDEEDNTKQVKLHTQSHIKIHDMVIINSQRHNLDQDQSSLVNVGSRARLTTNSTTTKYLNQTNSVALRNDNLPFTVRAISPSKFNENLVKNSRTIALQDETDKSPSKKYLVIPKEVAPFLANSQGPIYLDVPGIGPLLIQKPSDIFNTQPVQGLLRVNKPKYTKVLGKSTPDEPVYDPFSDSKYCWRYQCRRKRDLEGFTISDRLGFYQAEQQRTRTCAAKYQKILKTLESSIWKKERAVMAIRSTKLNTKNIKLVEIDSIKNGKKRSSLQNKHQDIELNMSPLPVRQDMKLSTHMRSASPIQLRSSESDGSDMGNDLLVTKKIVFINETDPHRGKKRKRRVGQFINQHRKNLQKRDKNDQESVGNNVHKATSMDRRKEVKMNDKTVLLRSGGNKRGRPRKKENMTTAIPLTKRKRDEQEVLSDTSDLPDMAILPDDQDVQNTKNKTFKKGRKQEFREPTKEVSSIRYPSRKQSIDLDVTESEKQLSQDRVQEIKPCYVELTSNDVVKKAVVKYNRRTLSNIRNLVNTCTIIEDLKQFQNHIWPLKPLLVINEAHCASMDFKDLFCKYNIIFPMSESSHFLNLRITNMLFVESAEKGYIKFVKPRILCRYLAGFREP